MDIPLVPASLGFVPIGQRAMVRGAIEAAQNDPARTIAEKTNIIADAFGLQHQRGPLERVLSIVC